MANILVIDDDAQIREISRKSLERAGHHVLTAQDGEEGLDLYSHNKVDLVITDILMPIKEGIEVIMQLKKWDPNVKIIAISGGGRNDPDAYLKVARHLKVDRTMEKPFDLKSFLGAIEEVLLKVVNKPLNLT